MKKLACGIAVAVLAGVAFYAELSRAEVNPVYFNREYNMVGYYRNTLVKFIPELFEYHTWYNEDGTATYANAEMLPNGEVSLKVSEGKWKFDDGYRPRAIPLDANGKEGVALELNNYYPGKSWRMLVPDGPMKGAREIYTIVPGHQ